MTLPKPYYDHAGITIYHADCRGILPQLPDESVDLVLTDPPYGIDFMGKSWDKALPDKEVWAECLRVLKPGAFAFAMSIPRADCLSRMIISLEDAGFNVGFTPIFWAYASGFPKAQNIGKAVDKRLGERGNESIGFSRAGDYGGRNLVDKPIPFKDYQKPSCISPQAKALDGSYGGFQPKPAVEVIIVAMKPLSEKTYVEQALKNGKGITWLDDVRTPIDKEADRTQIRTMNRGVRPSNDGWGLNENEADTPQVVNPQGRFPANLLVSDDALNDVKSELQGDSGSFSRYFDLDKWAQKTFPFLIVPKASKSEKNKGMDGIDPVQTNDGRNKLPDNAFQRGKTFRKNSHPTVKPLRLMSYLITLGSREGDVILDPFAGSGTTMLACKKLGRKCMGIEINEKYCEIAAKRLGQEVLL